MTAPQHKDTTVLARADPNTVWRIMRVDVFGSNRSSCEHLICTHARPSILVCRYVANELSSSVSAFEWLPADGDSDGDSDGDAGGEGTAGKGTAGRPRAMGARLQTLSTLPPGSAGGGGEGANGASGSRCLGGGTFVNGVADARASPDGAWVFVSNRAPGMDSIAAFRVLDASGRLGAPAGGGAGGGAGVVTLLRGRCPRGFSVFGGGGGGGGGDATVRLVVGLQVSAQCTRTAACSVAQKSSCPWDERFRVFCDCSLSLLSLCSWPQDDDAVVVLRLDESTGRLAEESRLSVGTPVCVVFGAGE